MNQTLFNTILRPLEAMLASMSPSIDQEAASEKLFFADFVRKLIFGYLYQNSSLRSLTVELETNAVCRDLDLQPTPFSTLKDGFSRFQSKYFKQLYENSLGIGKSL